MDRSERGDQMDGILIGHLLADLDEDALTGIIDSSSAQSDYLARFPGDREARALSAVCGVIAIAAESALIQRRTGITV
jgi:hypothetical protein